MHQILVVNAQSTVIQDEDGGGLKVPRGYDGDYEPRPPASDVDEEARSAPQLLKRVYSIFLYMLPFTPQTGHFSGASCATVMPQTEQT